MDKFEFKQVPKNAMQFNCGVCEFGDNGDEAKTAPFKMVARTGDPISHWFWGNVVHDNSGMTLHKNRLTIDYNHNETEVIGYANKIENENGDLIASGVIQSYKEGDRAGEVIFRGKNGHPYEASITHDGEVVLEEVPEGFSVTVNERQIEGPAVIIRQWALRGIAVCPYGADKNTSTELSESNTLNVKVLKMDQENLSEAVEAVDLTAVDTEQVIIDQATIEPEVATEVEAIAVETLELGEAVEILGGEGITVSKIDNTFTVELTAVEPLKEDETVELVVEQESLPVVQEEVIDEEKVSLQAELVELKRKLEALSAIGEKQPVTFNAEQSEADVIAKRMTKFQKSLSPGVASAAARIKLPKR